MSRRLFVVVDDRFVNDPEFLDMCDSADEVYEALCPDTTLIAIREGRRRWSDLLPKLVNVLEGQLANVNEESDLQVVVLVHMECFNTTYNLNGESGARLFCRFKPAEEDLGAEIRKRGGMRLPVKLEVYGLHLEEGTALYEVLKSVRMHSERFGQLIVQILDSSDPASLFEQISVVKHRIIGLFLPLDLTLQNWTEDKDPRLRTEVDSRLLVKLEGALTLLKGAEAIIKGGGSRADTSKVRTLLQASRAETRDAASFHAWINKLDEALDEVRKAVVS